MNTEIRKMTVEDVESIKNILESEFDDFWTYNVLKEEVACETSQYFVALLEDEIVGFIGFKIILGEADIMNVVTKKAHRNKGIASELLSTLISSSKEQGIKCLFLEVCEDNIPAISLYEKFGFTEMGHRRNYYKNKAGILMSL